MQSLSIIHFKALSRTEQYDIIHNFGVYLHQYRQEKLLFALYQLHSFYVEVVFKSEILLEVRAHYGVEELQKYLNSIDLSELGIPIKD